VFVTARFVYGDVSRVLSLTMPDHDSPAAAQASHHREPGFGLTLTLLSGLGTATAIASAVIVGWRVGLVVLAAIVLVLLAILRWEMRRAAARRVARAASQRAADLAVTGSNSL